MEEVIVVAVALAVIAVTFIRYDSGFIGRAGERRVRRRLGSLCRRGGWRLLNDVFIRSCGKESQIDHILIGPSGVFVIETKNYGGTISGKAADREWFQTLDRRRPFYNPVRQNSGHVRALRDLLDGVCPPWCIRSVVVFPSQGRLDTDTDIAVGLDRLRDRILSFPAGSLTQEQADAVASVIRNANIVSRKERRRHVREIRRNFRRTGR